MKGLGLCTLLLALALPGCQQSGEKEGTADKSRENARDETGLMKVTNLGEIRLRFFPDKAPGHVDNFKKLARQGFYDGTTFHRVIPRFMIQGGDPQSKDENPDNDGQGGPGYTIPAEFNDVPHRRGILSMARSSDPDSGGSQFFIMVADSPSWARSLDGKYTVFGEVTSGIEVVDKIAAVPRNRRDRPLENVVIESVTLEPVE